MALSLDDKLLGEKTHYYCSSSEDEDEQPTEPPQQAPPPIEYKGYSSNTGPKGVIEDWRRYKQLELENRNESEREKLDLAKKLQLTCRTTEDDERAKAADQVLSDEISQLEEFEDDFLKEYRQKRLEEMRSAYQSVPKFGKVIELDKEDFVAAIDNEKPTVTIIIHIYEPDLPPARR